MSLMSSSSDQGDGDSYDFSRRVAEAWASAPESWRAVQQEQLSATLTELRTSGDVAEQPAAPRPSTRRGLARRLALR